MDFDARVRQLPSDVAGSQVDTLRGLRRELEAYLALAEAEWTRTRRLLEQPIAATLLRLAAPNMVVMLAQHSPAVDVVVDHQAKLAGAFEHHRQDVNPLV